MKRFALNLCLLFVFALPVFSQTDISELKTVELFSLRNTKGKLNAAAYGKSCFNFIDERVSCEKSDIRLSWIILRKRHSDLFQAEGVGSRNKIKNLGKRKWTDDFKIPVVEPYAKLKVGEQREIVWDASGADGRDGSSGFTGGKGAQSPEDSNYVGTVSNRGAISPRRKTIKSDYHPFENVVLGNMYVMRVVDENNDFYVLFRVDELEKGVRCKISWKRVEAPTEK